MNDSLDGKVALVTGAARGQGTAIARMFAAHGARVVLADILDDEGRGVADELGASGHYVHLDVSSEAAWADAASITVDTFGGLDILVNNAGILLAASIADTTLDAYLRVIMINQVGCWLGMKTAAPLLSERGGGSIVNTSSLAGLLGIPGRSAYAASKFAVRGMTRVAALELGPQGIRVNAVFPGAIDTPMMGVGARAEVFARQPIPRVGTPDEVARLVLFLASDQSSYCTGAEFVVDGGLSAGVPT